jgi:hypothetical protein
MTPPCLTELACPACSATTWRIQHNYTGTDGTFVPYNERTFSCRACGYSGTAWAMQRQSPAWFLLDLQTHENSPEFQRWACYSR